MAEATIHYVALSSTNPATPYASWDTAATNIQNAVDVATNGDDVLVTNGLYVLASPIAVSKGIALRSVNGAQATTLDGANKTRCIDIEHAAALVTGFTIQHGWSTNYTCAGVTIETGMLADSVIRANSGYWSGGVDCQAGTLRGCLVVENMAYHIGGVSLYDGLAENCTIASNNADTRVGGLYMVVGATVRNCVISDNHSGEADDWCVLYTTQPPNIVGHTRLWPSVTMASMVDDGNVTGDPDFVDPSHGDYHLRPGSPCISAGIATEWMPGAVDLEGNPRITNLAPDMGAYERTPGPLMCAVRTDVRSGFAPLSVTLMAYVDGTNTAGLCYTWDIGADGSVDATGPGLDQLSVTFTNLGTYAVTLTVSNALGETATVHKEGLVTVGSPELFVATNGLAIPPYTNWTCAATSVQAAVDLAVDGTTVSIADGTYGLSSPVRITKGIRVRGASGDPSAVVLDGAGTNRGFYMSHSNAVLECLSVANSWAATEAAGGIVDFGGTLRNCIVRDNTSAGRYGGLYVRGVSLATNCTIVHNSAGITAVASGVMVEGGEIANCTIASNTAAYWSNGGGVAVGKGRVSSCTIIHSGDTNSQGGGLDLFAGSVASNCFIAWNTAGTGGGAYLFDTYDGPPALLTDCTIVSNRAAWGAGVGVESPNIVRRCRVEGNQADLYGGGVLCYDSPTYSGGLREDSLLVSACLITGNTASIGGGVYARNGVFDACRIVSNRAVSAGGGISTAMPYWPTLQASEVRNCLITANTAGNTAGGIVVYGTLANCTVVGNLASNKAGGVWVDSGSVNNTIMYGNTAPQSPNCATSVTPVQIGFSCCPEQLPGNGNLTNDPLFADAANGNFSLTGGSPCIDAGTALTSITNDITGMPRPLDGNNDGVAAWDMGAYEYLNVLADSDHDGLTDTNELARGTSPINADTDGDGSRDGDEVIAGTDPLDPLSYLRITTAEPVSDARLALHWSSVAARFYGLSVSTNLSAGFTELTNGLSALPPENVYTVTVDGASVQFYRVKVKQ